MKLFGFDSDLYLIVEGRLLCTEWKKPVVRGTETVIGEAETWPNRDPILSRENHLVAMYRL